LEKTHKALFSRKDAKAQRKKKNHFVLFLCRFWGMMFFNRGFARKKITHLLTVKRGLHEETEVKIQSMDCG
jgi:hypothetical protein